MNIVGVSTLIAALQAKRAYILSGSVNISV
jgi:hypothetical protein